MMTPHAFGYGKLDQPAVLEVLFHPRQEIGATAPPGVIDHDLSLQEGLSIGARFHLAGEDAPNILFFHGNGEIVADYDPVGPLYNDHELSFLA
ncbi:MAG: alpha/beta hydrolase, partial [Thermodesulfobacteriota bacterium]|nr:alpha/beta hydrolase [Thermodesulfobacteriota bacterium]